MPDDWFEDWFGAEYLALYEHRDHHEAREVVTLMADRMGAAMDAPVLDLACGAGRHQRMLCERGWWTVGLDLSPSLLRAARAEDRSAPLVRADMRELPFSAGWFVLDYLHADEVRRSLVPRDERTVGTLTVEQEREISADGRFVRKTITIGELGRTFVERVRLFEPSELVALCTQAGFTVDAVLGDYDGTAMRPDAPRAILFARRP